MVEGSTAYKYADSLEGSNHFAQHRAISCERKSEFMSELAEGDVKNMSLGSSSTRHFIAHRLFESQSDIPDKKINVGIT